MVYPYFVLPVICSLMACANLQAVGGSMIRDIYESKLENTSVKWTTVKRIQKETEQKKNPPGHDRIITEAGTNDCTKQDATIRDTIHACFTVLDVVCKMANEVIVPVSVQDWMQSFHWSTPHLSMKASKASATFVDHTAAFALADGTVNEDFLFHKGHCFTHAGTNSLVKNL